MADAADEEWRAEGAGEKACAIAGVNGADGQLTPFSPAHRQRKHHPEAAGGELKQDHRRHHEGDVAIDEHIRPFAGPDRRADTGHHGLKPGSSRIGDQPKRLSRDNIQSIDAAPPPRSSKAVEIAT